MSIATFIFYFFEFLAAAAALAIVFSRNVFYAALCLLTCLMAIAGLYVFAWAEFLAVTQILVYAGGILVVILFGIMLTAKLGQKPYRVQHVNIFSGVFATGVLLATLIYLFFNSPVDAAATRPDGTAQNVGDTLVTAYMLIFEVAGILLLIALIGAAVVASHKMTKAS